MTLYSSFLFYFIELASCQYLYNLTHYVDNLIDLSISNWVGRAVSTFSRVVVTRGLSHIMSYIWVSEAWTSSGCVGTMSQCGRAGTRRSLLQLLRLQTADKPTLTIKTKKHTVLNIWDSDRSKTLSNYRKKRQTENQIKD